MISIKETPAAQLTRGHSLKMPKVHSRIDIRKYHFRNRIISSWNNLTEEVVQAKKVKHFEAQLDHLWERQNFKWDFKSEVY